MLIAHGPFDVDKCLPFIHHCRTGEQGSSFRHVDDDTLIELLTTNKDISFCFSPPITGQLFAVILYESGKLYKQSICGGIIDLRSIFFIIGGRQASELAKHIILTTIIIVLKMNLL